MTQPELFTEREPNHHLLVEGMAESIKRDLAELFDKARAEIDERCSRIIAFAHRSRAQRKRFERIRQLTGAA